MNVHILMQSPRKSELMRRAFDEMGCNARLSKSVKTTLSEFKRRKVDLLVVDEVIGGNVAYPLIFAAEYHNTGLATVMLCDQPISLRDNPFSVVGSLISVLNARTDAEDVATIALYHRATRAVGKFEAA